MVMMKTPFLVLGLVAACGDDPVNYSAPVGIELKVKSSDATAAAIRDDQAITTEIGNP
jgi:hypothetical protein